MSWIRPLIAHGVRPWHKRLEITGPHNISQHKNWYNYLGLWGKKSISLFDSSEKLVNAINEFEPDVLYGYSGSLKLLTKYIQAQVVEHKNPKFIFGVSELVDEECRELIKISFGKELVDLYGAAEAGCIAWECKICKGYHINMDTVIVEFVSGDSAVEPGASGNIIVTNLHSSTMPIIRYNLGDIGIASPEKPVCGNGMALLGVVNGRADDFIVLPSGGLLSPLHFFAIMRPLRGIDQWKVTQQDASHLKVFVTASMSFSSEQILKIKSRIQKNIPEEVYIEIKVVDHIPMEKSGKIRSVFSDIVPKNL
jgi:phenylacetate-CoA ligase